MIEALTTLIVIGVAFIALSAALLVTVVIYCKSEIRRMKAKVQQMGAVIDKEADKRAEATIEKIDVAD